MTGGGSTVVGLTGGIGTGKSRVADLLEALGAAVECSDRIVRELQEPGGEVLDAIVETFGREFLTPSGELDREKLGERVFGDEEARLTLGRLIHPAVYQELLRRMEAHREAGVPVIVLDIPLLLEGRTSGKGSGALLPFDVIAVVYARPEIQLERIVARDGLPETQARARIGSQLPIDDKASLADVVIDNSGDWERTAEQVHKLYREWSRCGRSGRPR
jgi:dephospho-CoA kinase